MIMVKFNRFVYWMPQLIFLNIQKMIVIIPSSSKNFYDPILIEHSFFLINVMAGDKYIGDWLKGEMHGDGIKSQSDGDRKSVV